MVVPMGAAPVLPGALGPPAELTRYKPGLVAIAVGYLVIIVMGLVGGFQGNSLSYFLVVIIAFLMAFRSRDCLGQCVVPLTVLSSILLLFDVVTVVLNVSQGYITFENFFSTYCIVDRLKDLGHDGAGTTEPILFNGTWLYLQPNDPFTGDRTKVIVPEQECSWQSILVNLSLFGGLLLDCLAVLLGSQMWKAAQQLLPHFGGPGEGLVANADNAGGAGGAGGEAQRQRFTPFQGQPQALDF